MNKILILGGKPLASKDIVLYAKSTGAEVIVTDYLDPKNSPAKQIANKHWDLSTNDLDLISEKITREQINSIFTGIHEFNLEKTLSLAERHSFYFYCDRQQWNVFVNKNDWKKICNEHNLDVPQNYEFGNQDIKFPVIVKPIDGSSGVGVRTCHTQEELNRFYPIAIESSPSKKAMIESYIDGPEVTIFYLMQSGNIHLTAVADRYIRQDQGDVIPLPVAYTFPSRHTARYIRKYDENMKNVFKSLDIKNGMAFMQAKVMGEKIYIYDIGYRLTGSLEYKIFEKTCGFNPMKMMVDYALTGHMGKKDVSDLINPFPKLKAANVTFLLRPGLIKSIKGVQAILDLDYVIDAEQSWFEGELVPDTVIGTLMQVVLRVFIVAPNFKLVKEAIIKSTQLLNVLDGEGRNMLLPCIEPKALDKCEVQI